MSVAIVELEPWHLHAIELQEAQRVESWALGAVAQLRDKGPAWAAVQRRDDGSERVLCVSGLAEEHPRKATAWAMFADGKCGAMVAVTRAIRRVVEASHHDRLDMIVRKDFARAIDFALLLGFTQEAELRRFGEDGSDFLVFVRFREDPSTTFGGPRVGCPASGYRPQDKLGED